MTTDVTAAQSKEMNSHQSLIEWQKQMMANQNQGVVLNKKFIGIDNNQRLFVLPDGRTDRKFQGIIVDWRNARKAYGAAYTMGKKSPPVCGALGANNMQLHDDLIPDSDAPGVTPEQQIEAYKRAAAKDNKTFDASELDPSTMTTPSACSACAWNEWGSTLNTGGAGKQCKEEILIAVLPPNATTARDTLIVKLGRQSLASFSAHAKKIEGMTGLPLQGVVTEFSMDPNSSFVKVLLGNPDNAAPETHKNWAIVQEAHTFIQQHLNRPNKYDFDND